MASRLHYNIQVLENQDRTNQGEDAFFWKIVGTEHTSNRYFNTAKAAAMDVAKRFAVSLEKDEI